MAKKKKEQIIFHQIKQDPYIYFYVGEKYYHRLQPMTSSIEWLLEQVEHNISKTIIEQAKEMHKQEIIKAFDEGQEYEYQYHINNAPKFDSETYYQETFVSKGSDDKNYTDNYPELDGINNLISQQETLYTEEQVREVAKYTISEWASFNEQREHDHEKLVKTWLSIELQNFIQSLKQTKL